MKMLFQILFLASYLSAFLVLIYGLWLIVPFFYKLPWVPTDKARARRALEMAKLQPGETLFDLGAGDGRILLMAVEEFGAQAVGIEASPLQFVFTWARCFFNGSRPDIRVRRENFYHSDLSEADVIFAYLTPQHALRMQEKLATALKSGTRVVAIAFDFPDWKPYEVDNGELIFAYEMPPQQGGLVAYLAEKDE